MESATQNHKDNIHRSGSIGRLIDSISVLSGIIAGVGLFVVSLLTTYDALMRKVFGRPTEWVFTVSLFVLMWFVLLAAPIAIKEDRQIVADFLITRLRRQKQIVLKLVAYLMTVVFIVVVGYYGVLMCLEAYEYNFMNIELVEYPKWVLYTIFPLSTIILLMQIFRNVAYTLKELFSVGNPNRSELFKDSLTVLPLFAGILVLGIYCYHVKPFLGIIITVLGLLLSGIPAAFALGLGGIAGLFITQQGFYSLTIIPVIIESTLYNFILLAIPLFIMGGVILEKGGIGVRIFDLASKWMGSLPGGLAMATVVACAVVSAMIGVSTAVAAAIGLLAIPALISLGYDKRLAYGSVAGGALGVLIPPSAGLIVYAYLTNSSVGVLFAAAFLPAFILVGFFLLYIIIKAWNNKSINRVRYSWQDKLVSTKKSILGLFAPIIVLGGIYSGLFTPTEAAGVLVVYSLLVTWIYRELSFGKFIEIVKESAVLGSAIMLVMVGAMILSNEVALLRIPRNISQWLVGSDFSNISIIVSLMIMYFLLGMFLDGLSITVLTIPVLFPLMPMLGLDVIAFGVGRGTDDFRRDGTHYPSRWHEPFYDQGNHKG